ncbi:cyclic nucleotide-binding domain-containing protein [Tropicimonas sp. IMCC6043]|uniref:cyclic nucleotide-binding domain-containing protein n=1 Tax=Tropicimonas sp. IMCC6043 TaxID=2510645 RepID=UPI00101C5162|nr:cyclic nucleotide-binding domain-containing protein [Tropicimonas sp. IMCC6043]RYH11581.1 cyclic nucleotide-binding domain-containing protein [Tropicimonas sp. IMCC6043]
MTRANDPGRAEALLSATGAGLLAGGLASLYAVSFAQIVFAGPLSPAVGQGVRLALLGTLVAVVAALLRRNFTGTMWQAQGIVVVLTALAAAGIAGDSAGPASPVTVASVFVLLALIALSTGALMLAIGLARLGQIAKSIPYPVVGGFLAATGWLLVVRAAEIGHQGGAGLVAALTPAAAMRWLPPFIVAALMLIAERRVKSATALVVATLGLTVAVYAGIAAMGMSLDEARAAGLLLDLADAQGDAWSWALAPGHLMEVDWQAIGDQFPLIGTAALLAALGALLNLSAIEFATGAPVDIDAEMRAAGAANMISGSFGGFVGYQSTTLTELATGMHPRPTRLAPAVATGTVLAALLGGSDLLGLFPRSLFVMLLAYLGLGFLRRWLVHERARLPRGDYLIVLLILAITLAAGFVWAVGAGIVVASMRFTVAYSRLPALRSATNGAVRLSSTERSERATREIIATGAERLIFEVQGYMFFGTANALFSRIDRDMEKSQQMGESVRYLVIDLRRVQGIDVSALFMFDRLARQAARRGVAVIFAGLSSEEEARLSSVIEQGDVRYFPILDQALISLEEEVLASAMGDTLVGEHFQNFGAGFRSLMARIEATGAPVDFRAHEVAAGTQIFEMGEESDSLAVLESGRLHATLCDGDSASTRVATFLPGAVVGEMGLLTGAPRTANVVAETAARVRIVTRTELEALRVHDPELALELTERIATLIAQRLARTTALLHAVSR